MILSSDPAKKNSATVLEGPSRAGARSMLRAVGFSPEDLRKPIIGIANTWTEVGPCNFHLRQVAEAVKQGVREAGGTPMEFNTVTISDGITMGTEGMKASLISREVIADSIELVTRGNAFDGLVCIAGCDKNMPGAIMALCRLDIPGLMLYGGSIEPGHIHVGADGKPTEDPTAKLVDITIQNVYEAIGAHAAGKLTDAQLEDIEAHACPGAGACGGQFTANTMAMAGEFLGISPIQITGVPATDPLKADASREAGRIVMDLVRAGLRPSQIVTRTAIENAIAAVAASGGSTNAVLHMLAIAHEFKLPITIDDFDRISKNTPLIVDMTPGGKYVARDYQDAGGSRVLAHRLNIEKKLHRRQRPHRHRQDARPGIQGRARDARPGRHSPVVRSAQAHRRPRHPARQSRARGLRHQGRRPRAPHVYTVGTARVFDSEHRRAASTPSRPERSTPATCSSYATKARAAAPACRRCSPSPRRSKASPSSPRPSRCSPTLLAWAPLHGLMAGHVAPEAQVGGPIAAVREGDTITFDIPNRKLTLNISDAELAARLKDFKAPAARYPRGVFAKYANTVSSASIGAVTS